MLWSVSAGGQEPLPEVAGGYFRNYYGTNHSYNDYLKYLVFRKGLQKDTSLTINTNASRNAVLLGTLCSRKRSAIKNGAFSGVDYFPE
ncbi:hypothetical protein IG631_23933 [Alternaria alternata]|nr:hypothetical protein IG631_23933 [Alternaria alternata]